MGKTPYYTLHSSTYNLHYTTFFPLLLLLFACLFVCSKCNHNKSEIKRRINNKFLCAFFYFRFFFYTKTLHTLFILLYGIRLFFVLCCCCFFSVYIVSSPVCRGWYCCSVGSVWLDLFAFQKAQRDRDSFFSVFRLSYMCVVCQSAGWSIDRLSLLLTHSQLLNSCVTYGSVMCDVCTCVYVSIRMNVL